MPKRLNRPTYTDTPHPAYEILSRIDSAHAHWELLQMYLECFDCQQLIVLLLDCVVA